MGMGKPKTQTATTKVELDPATKAWQSTLSNMGANLYAQGAPEYYQGNTVAPMSAQTMYGMNQMQNQAMAGAPNYDLANFSATRALSGFNPAMGAATQFAMGNSAPQQDLDLYGMNSVNPYIDGMFQRGARQVTDAVNTQFAKAGRFGANAAYGQGLGNALGDMYTNIAMPAYESAAARGLQATGMRLNSQMQGAGMMGDLWNQGTQNAMAQQQLLPSLYQYGMAPATTMMGVGGMLDAYNQQQIDADKQRWDYNQNAPWMLANNYASLMQGLPSAQSTTQTQTMPGTNRFMSALGGAASGFGAGGPWGAAIGGLAGLFGGG